MNMTTQPKKQPANQARIYHVGEEDLPLSCPMKNQVVWNSHPRVYLPIEKTGRATCPYCGAQFVYNHASNALQNLFS